ncbi:MAG TPA: hypothetical protein VJS45_11875 [Acidimicrobiia bacterium]|nr:hypothetical protein [Acidimicrobiia bacterium]
MTETDRLQPLPDDYVETREALRRLAVYVLSPARKAVTGRIGLRATAGGFGTPPFGDDDEHLRVERCDLFRHKGSGTESTPITSLSAAADFAGVALSDDPGVGHDIPELGDPDAELPVASDASHALGEFYRFSDSILEEFRGELHSSGHECSTVQLWPEHFDLGCNIEGVNFGCSPGDGYSPEPYVYVGPWNSEGLEGDFWNAPFGATLSYKELLDSEDQRGAALEFLRRGAGLALQRAGEEP